MTIVSDISGFVSDLLGIFDQKNGYDTMNVHACNPERKRKKKERVERDYESIQVVRVYEM